MRKIIVTGTALLALAGASGASAQAATPAGSVQVSLTSPRSFTGQQHAANITCAPVGNGYVVRFGRTAKGGAVISGALTIPVYSGPGSYTGRLVVGATGPAGTRGGTLRAVHVSITATGGAASFSRTLSGARHPRLAGKVVAGTVDWTCAA
jgi:hypothetical protein